jgi:hypothetical protein
MYSQGIVPFSWWVNQFSDPSPSNSALELAQLSYNPKGLGNLG